MDSSTVGRVMEEHIFEAFESLEGERTKNNLPPSRIANWLVIWDLDDYWREWWNNGEDGFEWS